MWWLQWCWRGSRAGFLLWLLQINRVVALLCACWRMSCALSVLWMLEMIVGWLYSVAFEDGCMLDLCFGN
jgi:hypothetical protein